MAGRIAFYRCGIVRSNVTSHSGGTKLDSHYADIPENQSAHVSLGAPVDAPVDVKSEQLSLQDPRAVLSLLEADQVVAAKRRTHFGRKNLSFGTKVLLWGLRVYVLAMLVIVLISVYQAVHAAR
jgi:hypothetical protein